MRRSGMYFVWMPLTFLPAIVLLVPRPASACDQGYQTWKATGGSVCLPTAMVSYVSCLEASSKGQLSVEQVRGGSGSSTVRVAASGEGKGALLHGKGSATVDVTKSEEAVATLKKTFDPSNATNCYRGAFGAPARATTQPPRKRADETA